MSPINLRKILKKQELLSLFEKSLGMLNIAVDVEEVDGRKLISFGNPTLDNRYPVKLGEEVIGWVVGGEQATLIADWLSFLAKQEAEKKELAKELLERYQEIDLFEDISTQLTTSLETQQIAHLVLQEIRRLIESSAGIILLNRDGTGFEIIAEFGQFFVGNPPELGKGIIGNIVQSGRAELINDIQTDPRLQVKKNVSALICAPLRAKERVLGAIAIGTQKPDAYTAEHLKLVSIFASQTAVAIEKALLYEQSCQAATQAKAQAEKLQQALQDLQLAQAQLIQSEKMSSLGQLLAGVAHEINNPINFICGNLNYIADYAQHLLHLVQSYQKFFPVVPEALRSEIEAIELEFLIEDLPKLLASMKVGTERIIEIVQSLKNFSRHDEAELKTVNIHDGINGTLMILRHRLKATAHYPAIEVMKEYGELPRVECYPGQLNQVFMNILANGIDALEERMEDRESISTPQICIRTETFDDQWVVIRIADNGLGMTEEVLRQIYDPFFTTKDVGKGTGLGMAISHQIVVEKHRGILKCRSQVGAGTEFWIQIPVHCSEAIAASKIAIAPPPDAFMPSETPTLKSVDPLALHIQLLQRLSQQNPDVGNASPEQLYQLFQRYPISLKLYATLLYGLYSPNPPHFYHEGTLNDVEPN